jgi:hypothetical protein
MSVEMAAESMEIITMSVDKHQATKNYEVSIRNAFPNFLYPKRLSTSLFVAA